MLSADICPMRRTVWRLALAICGVISRLSSDQKRVVERDGFRVRYVYCCTSDSVVRKGVVERARVNRASTRVVLMRKAVGCINVDFSGFPIRYSVSGCKRHVQADIIGFGQH